MVDTMPGTRRKNLIIVRAGDHSLHREWLEPEVERNFDLFVSYSGDQKNLYAEDGQYYIEQKGNKFRPLYELIEKYRDLIFEYDAIMLPDDDIRANAHTLNHMFDMFHEFGLELAQPALSKNSHLPLTARHIDYALRYTRFVESMAPVFSREALRVCWHTFHFNNTGRGLDYIWPKLLDYPHKKIAILDAAPVEHMQSADEDFYPLPVQEDLTFYDGIRLWIPSMNKVTIHFPPAKRKQSRVGTAPRRRAAKPRKAARRPQRSSRRQVKPNSKLRSAKSKNVRRKPR